jgi:FtsZ-interacting cell division protein ZipA
VLPQITDPDLAPVVCSSTPQNVINTVVQKSNFLKDHKFTIIISIIVFLIVIVALYMYFTRRNKKKLENTPAKVAPGNGPEDINLEELNNLRSMRKQQARNVASQPLEPQQIAQLHQVQPQQVQLQQVQPQQLQPVPQVQPQQPVPQVPQVQQQQPVPQVPQVQQQQAVPLQAVSQVQPVSQVQQQPEATHSSNYDPALDDLINSLNDETLTSTEE